MAKPWDINGNKGTNPATDFLGTTDAQPLVIKVEGQERMRFRTDGAIRWGNSLAYPDSIELGGYTDNPTPGTTSTPFIDFHYYQDNSQDYNTRIMNDRNGQLTVFANLFRSTGDMGCRNLSVSGELTITVPGRGDPPIKALSVDVGSFGNAENAKRSHYFRTTDAGNTTFIIRGDGNVGIGTASPQVKLEVAGDVRANDVLLNSDARLKTDVARVTDALEKLQQIRGVAFTRLDPDEMANDATRSRVIGVIAQEVEEVFPELVDSRDEGYKAVDYGGLIGVLIEASKELKEENDELRQRIEAVEKAKAGRETE